MADVSRETFNYLSRYRSMLFQQGRPVLDSELNEMQAIAHHLANAGDNGSIGNMPYGDGMKLIPTSPASGSVLMLPGTFFNYGELVETYGDEPVEDKQVDSIQHSTTSTVVNNVYLVWSTVETDAKQVPTLIDDTLGIETAIRHEQGTTVSVTTDDNRLWLPEYMEAIFLGKVTRPIGQTTITEDDIADLRYQYNQNYVDKGFRVSSTETKGITFEAGTAIVANHRFELPVASMELTEVDTLYYIWINENGEIKRYTAKPGPPAVVLYSVKTDLDGNVSEIVDLRKFQPPLMWLIQLMLRDFLSPKRQLYAGDSTLSTITSLTPLTAKTVSIYSDPEVALDVREVGFIIRAKSIRAGGRLRLLIDDTVVVEHVLPADGRDHIYKSSIPVQFPYSTLHTVLLKGWVLDPTVPSDELEGEPELQISLFEAYVKESTFARRVNIFGDEGTDTVTSTTMTTIKESSFFSDPDVALHIKKLHYVGQWRGEGGPGKVQIFIDGNVYREFQVEQSDSLIIYKGTIDVAWRTNALHTVAMKMAPLTEGHTVYNRLYEIYVDQD